MKSFCYLGKTPEVKLLFGLNSNSKNKNWTDKI